MSHLPSPQAAALVHLLSYLSQPWPCGCIVCYHACMAQYCGVLCSFHALEVVNARALENANMAVIVGAIVLRAVVYSALYWTLPQDKQALLRQQAAESFVKDVPELTGENI